MTQQTSIARAFRSAATRTVLMTGLVWACSAQAATVSWAGGVDISGDADVSTAGSLVVAYNLNGSLTTVNGVTFTYLAVPNSGSYTATGVQFTADVAGGSSVANNGSALFASLSNAYQALLGTATATIRSDTLRFTGLAAGSRYQFQLWSYDPSETGWLSGYGLTVSGSALDDGYAGSGSQRDAGQFVIGSFTADASTQEFTLSANEVGFINGFQLRLLDATTVPAPGSLALTGLALALAAGARRRRA